MAPSKGATGSGKEYIAFAVLLVVILAILYLFSFSTGPSSPITSSCTPDKGYSCSNPFYRHLSSNFSVTIEQMSGDNWADVQILCVPWGTPYSNGYPVTPWTNATLVREINSSVPTSVQLHVFSPVELGNILGCDLWAAYQPVVGAEPNYVELGNVTAISV